jgi:hypothetical protein
VNNLAMLVSVPVATSHDVCRGVEIRALAMESTAETDLMQGREGRGSRAVPSKPDSPVINVNKTHITKEFAKKGQYHV